MHYVALNHPSINLTYLYLNGIKLPVCPTVFPNTQRANAGTTLWTVPSLGLLLSPINLNICVWTGRKLQYLYKIYTEI